MLLRDDDVVISISTTPFVPSGHFFHEMPPIRMPYRSARLSFLAFHAFHHAGYRAACFDYSPRFQITTAQPWRGAGGQLDVTLLDFH